MRFFSGTAGQDAGVTGRGRSAAVYEVAAPVRVMVQEVVPSVLPEEADVSVPLVEKGPAAVLSAVGRIQG